PSEVPALAVLFSAFAALVSFAARGGSGLTAGALKRSVRASGRGGAGDAFLNCAPARARRSGRASFGTTIQRMTAAAAVAANGTSQRRRQPCRQPSCGAGRAESGAVWTPSA